MSCQFALLLTGPGVAELQYTVDTLEDFESKRGTGVVLAQLTPMRPIWPGFAINTVFYAGILWLLVAIPARVRRWRRTRRGLCAKCAYPVGASEVCTECGAAIRPGGAAGCSHG